MERTGFPIITILIIPFILMDFFTACPRVSFAREDKPISRPADGDPGPGSPDTRAPMNDIHDIKAPVEPGIDGWLLFYFIAGLILAISLFGLIFHRWRYRRKNGSDSPERLPPDTEALGRLAELAAMDPSRGKRFYFRLSAILRNYIRRRYGIGAPEMTTEELLPYITGMGLPRELISGLKRLIVSADPVKFAGYPAIERKMRDDLSFVKGFVEASTSLMETDETETERQGTDV